jgi:hypothetical protein
VFSINDRVRLEPDLDEPTNPSGTVIDFKPNDPPGADDYVVVRWDDGREATFDQGALRKS